MAGSNRPAAGMKLEPCALPDIGRTARCGTLLRPENPARPGARQIPVAVAIVPARSGHARPDPIAILLGGPGESAIDAAAFHDRWLGPLLDDRDLLLVDQRGAGQSAALACDLIQSGNSAPLASDIFPPAAVKACAERLSRGADLTQYGYTNFAADLEQMRRVLGYGKLNLFSGSYGTRAAQVYLRAFPASVRTAYLGSVVPIDIATPIAMAATAQGELDHLFTACDADRACVAAFPELRTEFRTILARLDQGEIRTTLARDGKAQVLRRGPVASWVRSRLYRPASAAILPWAIHQAYLGNWQPIVNGIIAGASPDLSFGLFFALTCNEDVRFISPNAVAAGNIGFLRDFRIRQQQGACRYWPQSPLPAGYRRPVRSDVPVLMVTGENDGGTPTWFTRHAAKGFRSSFVLLAPGQGHTEWSDCIARHYAALVRDGAIKNGKDSCPVVVRPPFKLN
ncbi:alpha/beta fold hydrolase [Sphingomonas sp.]|uniref:alpha/beta fold hydrolase n=1 Tax=Sphingomonas sp. TaxID=28214 RepID=UPI003D6D20AC